MQHPPEALDQVAIFDLDTLEDELRQDEVYRDGGHRARTLLRTSDLRVVLLVMKAGSHMAEHSAEETASIQMRSGEIRLRLPDETITLSAGQLLVIEAGQLHDVEATADSAFVLTLGWR